MTAPTCVPRAPLCTHWVPPQRLGFCIHVLQRRLTHGSLLLPAVNVCCNSTSVMAVPCHCRSTASTVGNGVLLPLAGGIFGVVCASSESGGERRKAGCGSQTLAQVQPGRSPIASADVIFVSAPRLIPPSLSSHLRNSTLRASGFAGEGAACYMLPVG